MKQNKKKTYLIIVLLIAVIIGIGYAALSATLNINGQTTISKASWDIHFENLQVTSGSITPTTEATIEENSTTVNFGITLSKPGEFYEFSVDAVNKGTIDAMISTISKTGLSTEQAKYLNYIVEYSSGAEITEKQQLNAGEKETIKVRIEFRSDVDASSLPTAGEELNLTFSISYQQKESNAIAISHPICKRATVLHTETCNQTSNYCVGSGYETGDTITYGNLGTTGVLTSGDAFDCDVNGDGVYDSGTERFYYVSDKDADSSSNYATLIYYNNVSAGAPNNTTTFAYISKDDYVAFGGTESDFGDRGNWNLGPLTILYQLPTIEQWNNVSLSTTTRNILDESGNIKVSNFSYKGYAARLLTVQEINSGCGTQILPYSPYRSLDKCQYLMENTKYTNNSLVDYYWLESPYYNNVGFYLVWQVSGRSIVDYVNPVYSNEFSSVRPVIEVEKTKVNY